MPLRGKGRKMLSLTTLATFGGRGGRKGKGGGHAIATKGRRILTGTGGPGEKKKKKKGGKYLLGERKRGKPQ